MPKDKAKKSRVTANLPMDLWKALNVWATDNERSLSKELVITLRQRVEREKAAR